MKKIIIVLALMAGLWGVVLPVAQAANIVDVNFPCPGGNIPGFPECERTRDGKVTNDFVGYVLQAYQFGIGIVGIIAVGMIVYGGILIAWNTESIDKKGKGREMITSALTGIAVLFGSYLLLNTINPELVKFNLAANIPEKKSTTTLSGVSGSGNYVCGKPGDIRVWPEGITNVTNCASRNLTTNQDIDIKKDSYYNASVEIKTGAKLWLYPYFIKSTGPTGSAKCLIYAYQNPLSYKNEILPVPPYIIRVPVPGETEKIYLQDSLDLCGLTEKQNLKSSGGGDSDSHNINLSRLSAAGVEVKSSGNCSDINKKECTSLTSMPTKAIDFLVDLAGRCKSKEVSVGNFPANSCLVRITGGTETGHAEHGAEKAVFDLHSSGWGNEWLGALLTNSSQVKKICTSNGPEKAFRKNCSTVEESPHFHVSLD